MAAGPRAAGGGAGAEARGAAARGSGGVADARNSPVRTAAAGRRSSLGRGRARFGRLADRESHLSARRGGIDRAAVLKVRTGIGRRLRAQRKLCPMKLPLFLLYVSLALPAA